MTLFSFRRYKNKVSQEPGWNNEVLEWCLLEAKDRKLRDQDFWGGFVIDEMKIQVTCLYSLWLHIS